MNAQRRPAPKRIASSISSTVATSSATSHSASRHSASSRRSATNASTSWRSTSGRMPSDAVDRGGALHRLRRGALAAAHLDERQQVDGVERMPDGEALGVRHVGLQAGGQQAGRGGGEHRVRRRPRGSRAASSARLSASRSGALSCTNAGALHGLLGRGGERQRPLGGQRRERQPAQGAARVGEHLPHDALRVRGRVVEAHVDAVEEEARRPAAADHAAAEQRPVRVSHAATRPSRSRTSPGPSTRAFIASRIVTARSTSSRVRGQHAAREVEVVLEPDAHVAARERGHGDVRQLHAPDREGGEHGARRAAGGPGP